MKSIYLLHHLLSNSAQRAPSTIALTSGAHRWTYHELASLCRSFAMQLLDLDIQRQERVAIFTEKRVEFVVTAFGASWAGAIFIPINPILKNDQIHHILKDSSAKVFVTSKERFKNFTPDFFSGLSVRSVFIVDASSDEVQNLQAQFNENNSRIFCISSCHKETMENQPDEFVESLQKTIDTDAVSIFYTSGSTGRPKGVVLSHRNMVFGAKNVSAYLENVESDVLLAALPLSFDAGFSQLTTAFYVGARVVLLNYLVPQDILKSVVQERVTGLTAVPPLWMQVLNLKWPESVNEHFRYFANTGGRMPLEVLKKLRVIFSKAKPFLMYGLTESFRSTYLPPEEVDRIPSSMGRAIPNAEILILRADGTPCDIDEPGELVHRGALVGLGYWNDPEKTAERYKFLPAKANHRPNEIVLPEMVVFSGDIVRRDADGFIFFIGRNDEMIKTSGYRVSPTEVEEAFFGTGLVAEAAAFGKADVELGQRIVISILPINAYFGVNSDGNTDANIQAKNELSKQLLRRVKEILPTFMVPSEIVFRVESHPRNQNGKIDRRKVAEDFEIVNANPAQLLEKK